MRREFLDEKIFNHLGIRISTRFTVPKMSAGVRRRAERYKVFGRRVGKYDMKTQRYLRSSEIYSRIIATSEERERYGGKLPRQSGLRHE